MKTVPYKRFHFFAIAIIEGENHLNVNNNFNLQEAFFSFQNFLLELLPSMLHALLPEYGFFSWKS